MQPIETAWNILKALSREDLEMAARTGGVPRMSGTMRPEFDVRRTYPVMQFRSGNLGPYYPTGQDLRNPVIEATSNTSPLLGELSQPPAYDERSEMMQEYNELINPEEEAEHQRINAPTPVRAPVMRRNRKTKERFMAPGAPMPVGEAGEASMDDPSQMEHLGAQLAHADMMRDDVNPAADVPMRVETNDSGGISFMNLPSHFSRAPNRQAYMTRR
jgi:hypothetical protein